MHRSSSSPLPPANGRRPSDDRGKREDPNRMLRLESVNVFIEQSHILRDVSLAVEPGRLVCLVGRNGAGKTTTLRTIMGYLRPASGRIAFREHLLTGRRTHEIARLGIAFAPEDGGVFGDLSVAE